MASAVDLSSGSIDDLARFILPDLVLGRRRRFRGSDTLVSISVSTSRPEDARRCSLAAEGEWRFSWPGL
ncbi:hypothetical protein BDZ85DRAFT_263674 [Elsinoe ampelina]|uniref:Uncharacterized protein n=1 Tax=Elsinoe ampelina TaxID=302913 RepID=A0A6A6G9M6_9PEZI|nr:hypothetical protein BDZ85DRAFT_263674 [Elsinoe ampelina]